jgi:hypothetical protein
VTACHRDKNESPDKPSIGIFSHPTTTIKMTGLYMLDYGAGNVRSLVNAVEKLGYDITFVKDPADLKKADVSWNE